MQVKPTKHLKSKFILVFVLLATNKWALEFFVNDSISSSAFNTLIFLSNLVVFIILIVSPKKSWLISVIHSKIEKHIYYMLFLSFFLGISYLFLDAALKSNSFITKYNNPDRFWVSTLEADSILGWKPKPNSISSHVLYGDTISWYNNDLSIRTNNTPKPIIDKPYLLAVGCSWTEGADIPTESTYVEIAARAMGAVALNGGVSNFGFSQMYLRAIEVINKYKPQYMVIQYTRWLSPRSQQRYADMSFGYNPRPFIYKDNAVFKTHLPLFNYTGFNIQKAFKEKSRPINEPYAFIHTLPFFIKEKFQFIASEFYLRINNISTNGIGFTETTLFYLDNFKKLCDQNNINCLVVTYDFLKYSKTTNKLLKNCGIPVLDGIDLLFKNLKNDSLYTTTYGIKKGTPPKVVDLHPNVNSNLIIGQAIGDYFNSH